MVAFLVLFFVFARSAGASSKQEIKRINRYLQSTPMRGTGKIIVNQSRKHGINPYFVVAVSIKESSAGAAACSNNRKNVWGLGACGRVWRPPYFENWIEAVNYFVRFINSRWPSAQTPFQFYGYYSGCETEWGNSVAGHMRNIGGTERVR